MNAIPDLDLEGDDTEKRLERLLYSLKGDWMPAVNVMEAIGMEFTIVRDSADHRAIVPHSAFIRFYWLVERAKRFFERHGFYLHYIGPFAAMRLVPLGFDD